LSTGRSIIGTIVTGARRGAAITAAAVSREVNKELGIGIGNVEGTTQFLEVFMFDSLDEQIRKDEDRVSTSGQRMMRYVLYAVAGAVVIGGLLFGVHLMN
jgi:hypothetical protein